MFTDPEHLLAAYGVIGIAVVLFCETGLLVGLLLPGETLTILAGAYSHGAAGRPHPDFALVVLAAAVGAIAGGQIGYLIGRRVGPSLFDRKDGKLFKHRYVERTHRHFAKYGPATLLIGRFIPFVRTLVSPAAGIGEMPVTRFTMYNIGSGMLWALCVATAGYVVGGLLPIGRSA